MNGAKVLLCEEQSESLKKLAAERGQTVTALVHDAVNRYLHQQKIQDSEAVMFRARTANGGFPCEEADEYFAEDYAL